MNCLKKIKRAVYERGEIDALLLTSPVNRFYASGCNTSDGMVLITQNEAYFITDFRYIEAAEAQCGDEFHIKMITREESYPAVINKLITEHGINKVGIEENRLSYAEYLKLGKELRAELIPSEKILTACRAVKEAHEIDMIRKAQKITDDAYIQILGKIKAGMTEKDLYTELIYTLYKCGASGMAFDPIVVSGTNSSMPHGVATDKVIENGDFVTMDFGAIYGGYCSDMTRTVAVGYAADKMINIYNIVLEAQATGLREAKAGIKWQEVDKAARDVITKYGYGGRFGHGLGHGVGIEIHEAIAPSGEVSLPGSIATVEPGIYIPSEFGVRTEDMVILLNGGNENLTKSSKDLIIIE